MGNAAPKPITDLTVMSMPEDARAAVTNAIQPARRATMIKIEPPGQKPRAAAGGFGENSLVNLGDFVITGEEEECNFSTVYDTDATRLTPYCLDHMRRRVIFIEADPDTILASTFIYTGQRQHAIRCYAVPYGELCDVFEARMESGWESNVFQLYSTGRCGSTLLSKLLDQANSIVSISEPDVFSYVTFLLSKDANCFEGDDLPRLLRAITWSLYDFAVGADPTKSAVCLKYRAQVIALAPTLKKSIPEAKSLFLYREGIATIDSFCMAFLGSWGARTARWLNLDSLFISKLSGWVEIFDYLMPYVNKDGAPPKELYLGGGFPAFMTMIWLSNMDSAYELASAGFFDAVVRYEDLCVHRLIVVNKLLEAVGMEGASLSGDADKVFDEDAHASSTGGLVGSRGASMKKKPLYIPPSDLPALQTLIASHSELNSCNFVLPNTLKF